MSASSNYVYTKKSIPNGILFIVCRNTLDFMGLWILAEMGLGCLFSFFQFSPSNHSSSNFSITFQSGCLNETWHAAFWQHSPGWFSRNHKTKNVVDFLSFYILMNLWLYWWSQTKRRTLKKKFIWQISPFLCFSLGFIRRKFDEILYKTTLFESLLTIKKKL